MGRTYTTQKNGSSIMFVRSLTVIVVVIVNNIHGL